MLFEKSDINILYPDYRLTLACT